MHAPFTPPATTPTIQNPETFTLPGGATCFVGIHIGSPNHALTFNLLSPIFPPDNFIGLLLLRRLLTNALNHADLLASPVAITGPLQDCIIMAKVTDPLAAVEILKTELATFALLGFSQIGILEDSRGWRCVYPSAAVRMEYLMDDERHGNYFPRVVEDLRAAALHAAEIARALLARPDATPEQREAIADTLRALEQMLPTIVWPPQPETE